MHRLFTFILGGLICPEPSWILTDEIGQVHRYLTSDYYQGPSPWCFTYKNRTYAFSHVQKWGIPFKPCSNFIYKQTDTKLKDCLLVD